MTGGESPPPPPWLGAVVDRGSDAVAVFDRTGTITYANAAAHDLLVHRPGALVGRNAFDLVHPGDLGRAAASVGGVGVGARPRPGLLRVLHGDGTHALIEILPMGIDLPDPPAGPGPVTAVVLRENYLQDAHWRFLTALTAGDPFHRCLHVLAEGLSHPVDGPMGIAYDDAGRRVVAGPLAPELAGVVDGEVDATAGTPWAVAMATGQPAWSASADLPDGVGSPDGSAGLACVAVPVPDPASGRPALIVQWPPEVAMGEVLAEALVRRPRRAVLVALQRREANERLERLARRDALTGVANRSHFIERLEALAIDGAPYGICYVDLDRFKEVNDTRGHQAGDEALVTCARRIVEVVGTEAVVGRLGGDEFAVALAVTDEAELAATATELVARLAEPVRLAGEAVVVGASVGAALADGDRTTDAVMAAADVALYEAKRSGRSAWRLARPDGDPTLPGGS